MTSLLCVKNLSVQFSSPTQGDFIAVQDLSYDLKKSKTLALVGESGSGKSVSVLALLGLLPKSATVQGKASFEGENLLAMDENSLQKIRGKDIAMVFQEPMTALNPLHTIERQITEPLLLHEGLTPLQARNRTLDLLKLVGFPEGEGRLNAYPHELSGGQRQRVMIAMSLACSPKILIADEPTTALDVTIQAGIIKLLKRLQDELQMGLILISHDLGMVRKFATKDDSHIAVMKNGHCVEYGDIENILKRPEHPYTQHLIAAEPHGEPRPITKTAKTILTCNHLSVSFGRKKSFWHPKAYVVDAVKDASFTLKQGETIGIVGESGSGKSTLAYALLKLLPVPYKGEVAFDGKRIDTLRAKELRALRAQLQIIFQDPFSSLNPRFSASQIVGEGLRIHEPHLNEDQRRERILLALEKVGLGQEFYNRYPHEFSGGQRQRLAIARALILNPHLVVLDEPTSALDRSIQAEVIELLRNLQKEHNLSYLFISHDLKVVRAMSHRIIVMKGGQIVEEGPAQKVFETPQHAYTQILLKAAI